ncbi:autotransporter outer membrane beta-barrel domain-containing protein [Bradyrhizobium sp.]|uniref:autotransporter outer membrane beta-barrel domain-containing protein n=1 Tax=Bradyrhizobium sp. TaxID=376 RepID=UPI0025C5E892|nr:autotransporter outer membrane beta-barrel domain-containing protein [Bradyrhizobium sp.]
MVRAIAMAIALAIGAISSAEAQLVPSPSPTPTPGITIISSDISANQAVGNLGSSFLERLAGQATNGVDRIGRGNPGGGGASEATEAPKFRAWVEGYGLSSRTDAQGDFAGDRRTTWGGVAGIGATVGPGVNFGLSVDQSRSKIDVPLAFQWATLDLTQVGASFSIDKGPWTLAGAFVHGFGKVNSNRDTGAGIAVADYNAALDGGIVELDYYWMKDEFRIVPKIALEYVRSSTDAFTEQGAAFFLVTASNATAERARALIGAEVGRYFIFDRKILDLSAYGKFIDNFHQSFSTVTVSIPGFQPVSVQGIGESRYGADAGAAASLSLTNSFRLYARYDGKFREHFQSHQGLAGLEVRW